MYYTDRQIYISRIEIALKFESIIYLTLGKEHISIENCYVFNVCVFCIAQR